MSSDAHKEESNSFVIDTHHTARTEISSESSVFRVPTVHSNMTE